MLTDQWYVNAKTLAKPAIKAVENGKTKFVPETLDEDLLRVDAQHRAVVRLAPALVGPSHSGVVRAGQAKSSSPTDEAGAQAQAQEALRQGC